jgi:spore coat polysaccharide biosynthesis protein SpsF
VLKEIVGQPMLLHIVERLRFAPGIHTVAVATSDREQDEPIRTLCRSRGVLVFGGDEEDVLTRFYRAAVAFDADPILRVTADCPFVDPDLV